MRTAQRRLSVAQFEAVKALVNMSEERIEAARLTIVDGQTHKAVAELYGWTPQAVDAAVRSVWKTFGRYSEAKRAEATASTLLPKGWEQVTLTAPRALIAEFREQIARAVPAAPAAAKKSAAKTRPSDKSTKSAPKPRSCKPQ